MKKFVNLGAHSPLVNVLWSKRRGVLLYLSTVTSEIRLGWEASLSTVKDERPIGSRERGAQVK